MREQFLYQVYSEGEITGLTFYVKKFNEYEELGIGSM